MRVLSHLEACTECDEGFEEFLFVHLVCKARDVDGGFSR